jgi:hypothetical protein
VHKLQTTTSAKQETSQKKCKTYAKPRIKKKIKKIKNGKKG